MTISHNGRVFLLSGGHCHSFPALSMQHMTCSQALPKTSPGILQTSSQSRSI